jgi:uroporphyrinogen-III synthase
MRVLLTRPRHQAEQVAAILAACGHEALVAPLFAIKPLPLEELPAHPISHTPDLLLFTSQQAPACLPHALCQTLAGVPVAAIGPASAQAARRAGLGPVVLVGSGVRAQFFAQIAAYAPRHILFLAGTPERGDVLGELAALGLMATRVLVYQTQMLEHLPEAAHVALQAQSIDWLLLFSPRSAQAFVQAYPHASPHLRVACLSLAVAQALPAGRSWGQIVVADKPNLHALLASAGLLCQKAEAMLALEQE